MERSLIERVSAVPTVTVEGTWQRSVTERWAGHYVDNEPGMRPELVRPRVIRQCTVRIEQVLDLTTAQGRVLAGLDVGDLRSAVDDYEACQAVAHAAHQFGRHGVLAPAATGLGDTLAVFVRQLGPAEFLDLVGESERWVGLPPDPRRLRLIEGSTG